MEAEVPGDRLDRQRILRVVVQAPAEWAPEPASFLYAKLFFLYAKLFSVCETFILKLPWGNCRQLCVLCDSSTAPRDDFPKGFSNIPQPGVPVK